MLRATVQRKGVPLAIYSDRHGIFFKTKSRELSLEEQLDGRRQPTQFARLLEELGIQLVTVSSPGLDVTADANNERGGGNLLRYAVSSTANLVVEPRNPERLREPTTQGRTCAHVVVRYDNLDRSGLSQRMTN